MYLKQKTIGRMRASQVAFAPWSRNSYRELPKLRKKPRKYFWRIQGHRQGLWPWAARSLSAWTQVGRTWGSLCRKQNGKTPKIILKILDLEGLKKCNWPFTSHSSRLPHTDWSIIRTYPQKKVELVADFRARLEALFSQRSDSTQ